jgi:hypothetical protein
MLGADNRGAVGLVTDRPSQSWEWSGEVPSADTPSASTSASE